MKRLEKIRLINWHRFVNDTVEVGDSVLLSGENGAGKSTLLDAVQFVVTCSKANFNKAAHEKGKRTLNGYVRYKTGAEDKPYERSGAISAHVALQFFDEARNQPFIVGVVIDSASEEKEPNCAWYLMEKQELEDSLFLQGKTIKSISVFRSTNKKIRTFATTQAEAKKMILSRFGRIEDKFFSLIPKALAFRPIHDIKDFVYSYVLDKKEVNIDALKENVRSYQDLERMLQDVKKRIGELEKISAKETEVENYLRVDRNQEYYIARVDVEITEEEKQNTDDKRKLAALRTQELERQKSALGQKLEERQETITNLSVELNGDADFQALHELERRESQLEEDLEDDQEHMKELRASASRAIANAAKLVQFGDVDACIPRYMELLRNMEESESLADLNLCLGRVTDWKKKMNAKIQQDLATAKVSLQTKKETRHELEEKIRQLEKKHLTYPAEVTALAQAIRAQFRQANRTGDVNILCEMLEITKPAWQNAVEGYLNTQRFYLVVEPENFDLALSVYDKMREGRKAYGVGLVNTAGLEKYDEAPEGTLADAVKSKSIWARRYANMILGRVHRVNGYQELKKYDTAITRQCMRYQNHVVSAIRPEIFETPYIGAEAYSRQLEQCRKQEAALNQEIREMEKVISRLDSVTDALDTEEDVNVKFLLPAVEERNRHETQLNECRESMEKLETNQTLIEKRMHLLALQDELKRIQTDISETDRQIGSCEREAQGCTETLERLEEILAEQKATLGAIVDRLGNDRETCSREYERQRQRGERVLQKFKENFERARKGNATSREKAEKEMTDLMNAYKVAHDFGAAATREGYVEFETEYDKLKNSQLLTYEEKVVKARQSAEQEFREQFLSRLQENIKQAQTEFKELNRSLKEIHFAHEQYEFLYEPRKALKKYYQMIMDDFNVLQGESLFSGMFEETHREVIEELFEKLAQEDESSAKILEEYTDYRTYLDYDIRITNEDGTYMLYSKVSQEKSGGETQTPFYITVAASFMQLYRNSIGGDAIGLVMLDEAFNNMDDERIAGVLEFMTSANNLQLIIAAPPDKIQYIGPAVKQVLLVLKEDPVSYVEDFTRLQNAKG